MSPDPSQNLDIMSVDPAPVAVYAISDRLPVEQIVDALLELLQIVQDASSSHLRRLSASTLVVAVFEQLQGEDLALCERAFGIGANYHDVIYYALRPKASFVLISGQRPSRELLRGRGT